MLLHEVSCFISSSKLTVLNFLLLSIFGELLFIPGRRSVSSGTLNEYVLNGLLGNEICSSDFGPSTSWKTSLLAFWVFVCQTGGLARTPSLKVFNKGLLRRINYFYDNVKYKIHPIQIYPYGQGVSNNTRSCSMHLKDFRCQDSRCQYFKMYLWGKPIQDSWYWSAKIYNYEPRVIWNALFING